MNLEPALRLSDRLGGHLVTVHVDGIGKVISLEFLSNFWRLEGCWKEPEFGRYICEKGSIAIDGISLTVVEALEKGSRFSVAVIPHTWESTSLQFLSLGSLVNLEADLMAKYAESLLGHMDISSIGKTANHSADVTKDWLAKHGWS